MVWMILNENLRFENVDHIVKRAFLRVPERVLIAARTRLYKWTNRPLSDGSRVTPWWSFVESIRLPSGMLAEGFRVSEERAARHWEITSRLARARAAISDQFGNTMANLLLVELKVPVWGFAGKASGQPEFADDRPEFRHVFLIGGTHQVWVPELKPQHVTAIPVAG